MDSLRIFHVTTVHSRNDVRIAAKECPSLVRFGLGRVVLLVADGRGDERRDGFDIRDLGRLGTGRIKRILFGNWRVYRFVASRKKAVVHFHDPELMLAGIILKLSGHRVIYDIHENVPAQIQSKHYLPYFLKRPAAAAVRALERACFFVFDAFVAATSDIAARFPVSKTVLVCNYPLGHEFFPPEFCSAKMKESAFVYAGGISRIRGALEMVEALGYLDYAKSPVRLYLAGKFDPPEIKSELEARPGWLWVKYLGWLERPEMVCVLASARAGLLILHPEENHLRAQPNKLFEYMAAGLPVIASDFPLWREIVEGAGCGLLIDPRDPRAIAEAMQWILENPRESERMGRRGRRAVELFYNWECEAVKLTALYRDIVK